MVTGHWEDEGLLGDADLRMMTRENLLAELRMYHLEKALTYRAKAEMHGQWIREELEVLGGLAGAW